MSRTNTNPNTLPVHGRATGLLRCAALVIAAGAIFPHTALAATINVPADYPTIQDAINVASAGDTILVHSAFSPYSGPGNVNLDTLGLAITVRSTGGAGVTSIDGGGTAGGFNIHSGETAATVIEGFTVSNCVGFGLIISGADPTINNCIIPSGTDLSNASPVLTGCDLTWDWVNAGGLRISGGSPQLTSCLIDSCWLHAASSTVSLSYCTVNTGWGTGITNGTLKADNCEFNDNYDGYYGGGVVLTSSTATFSSCDISRNGNDPDQSKGGGVKMIDSTAAFVSCTINDNWVGTDYFGYGGGVYVDPTSSASFVLTTIKGNVAADHMGTGGNGGGVCIEGKADFTDCPILSNAAGWGGGVAANTNSTFRGCSFAGNYTSESGGGAFVSGAAVFTRCTFDQNSAGGFDPSYGGGAYVNGPATFDGCLFTGNFAYGDSFGGGGGGAIESGGGAMLVNCIFANNSATNTGGAVGSSNGDRLVNCTLYGNAAATAGAIDASGTPVINNSILWNNGPSPIGGSPAVSFSDVEFGYPGALNAAPKFVNPALLDFRLQQGSPCIDKGSNGLVPLGITKDYNLNPRVRKGDLFSFGQAVVDMGATEFRMVINDLPASKGSFTVANFHGFVGPGPGTGDSDINDKGTFMVAGGIDANTKGRAFVVAADADGNWIPHSVVTPPDGHIGDFFGLSVALGDDRLAIGAPRNKQNGTQAGAVYIYRLDGDQWVFETKLTAPDASAGAQFGYSVALEGDILLAGAWRADPDGLTNAGAVYAFHLDGDQWVHEATLAASDPEQDAQFGWTLDLSEAAAIVGAPLAQQGAGQAYIFHRAGDQWYEEAILAAPEPAVGDQFGFAVGLWGRRAIVGVPGRDVPVQDSGAAYLFEDSFGQWEPVTEFIADTPGATQFGIALAIEGDVVAVGAPGTDAGQAEVFSLGETVWEHNATVIAESGTPGDQFGRWITLGSGTLAASAPKYNDPNGPGAVYPFDLYGKPCYADFTGDGILDLFDFLGYVNTFNAGDPAADCTADANLDLFDFLCFMNEFGNGC